MNQIKAAEDPQRIQDIGYVCVLQTGDAKHGSLAPNETGPEPTRRSVERQDPPRQGHFPGRENVTVTRHGLCDHCLNIGQNPVACLHSVTLPSRALG
jgi:hypothetical protein